jgi:hypothetical protein
MSHPLAKFGAIIVKIFRGLGSLATVSCSELAAGALGRGLGVTPSTRKGPQALNFKIPAVTRLVSRAPKL